MFSEQFIEQLSMFIIRPPREIYGIDRLGPKTLVVKSASTGTYIEILRQEVTILSNDRTLQLSIFEPQNKNIYQANFQKTSIQHKNRSTHVREREPYMSKSTQFASAFKETLDNYFETTSVRNQRTQETHTVVTASPQITSIFLHSNSGSRLQGLEYAKNMLQYNQRVCLFDYSASGMSEGEFITMGLREAEDLNSVVNYLKNRYKIERVNLWGRSMGAVTAVIYSSRYPNNVQKMVLDSPFSNFRQLLNEIVNNKTGLPQFLYGPVMTRVQQMIISKTGYNLMEIDLMKKIKQQKSFTNIPCLFLVSKEDKLVNCAHVESMHENYTGEKKLLYLEGSHNKPRPTQIKDACAQFLNKKNLNSNSSKKKIQLKKNNFLKMMIRKNSDEIRKDFRPKFSTSTHASYNSTPPFLEHYSSLQLQRENDKKLFIPLTPNQAQNCKFSMKKKKDSMTFQEPISIAVTDRNPNDGIPTSSNKQIGHKNVSTKISLSQLKKNYVRDHGTSAVAATRYKQQIYQVHSAGFKGEKHKAVMLKNKVREQNEKY